MSECTTYRELVGTATNLMIRPEGVSASRVAMFGSHIAQTPQIDGAEPRTLFTGFEREYAKYMFNVIVEHDCTVIRVIDRHATANKFGVSLETLVITERLKDKAIDVIIIPKFESNHQYFGFELIRTEAGKNIRPRDTLLKGTVLAETPSVINKEMCSGTQANVILVSHPQVIEDDVVISDRLADKLNAWAYKTHRLFIGSKSIPLLPYGDKDNPKLFPDIGERVREDGILYGTRPYDPLLAAVTCSKRALREPCTHFDDCVIVDKEAVVTDIKVYRNDLNVHATENGKDKPHTKMHTPSYIQSMLDEYYNGTADYNKQIRDTYMLIKKNRNMGLSRKASSDIKYSPLAHQTILNAIAFNPEDMPDGMKKNRRKQFNKDLMEDYVVEITIKYPIPMATSGKLTEGGGGKGIVGEVRPLHLMPVNDYGHEVDIMMADNALLRRTNFNRPFEAYVNAALRDVTVDVLALYDANRRNEAWNLMLDFLRTASPEYARVVEKTYATESRQHQLIDWLHDNKMRMWIPADSEKEMDIVERDIEAKYPPKRSPVTFTLADGSKVRTEATFIVGNIYIYRLDKTGRESFSISAGRYQQFGTIAKQHSADKYRRPIREQPIKFMGEAENKHLSAYTKEGTTAELHDRSNNPIVMDQVLRTMLTHETPSNIDCAVDRTKYPLGNNRTMLIVNHVFQCEGVRFTTRVGNITESSQPIKG